MVRRSASPPDSPSAVEIDVAAEAANDAALIARLSATNSAAIATTPSAPTSSSATGASRGTSAASASSAVSPTKKKVEKAQANKGKAKLAPKKGKAAKDDSKGTGAGSVRCFWKPAEDRILLTKLTQIKVDMQMDGANFKEKHYLQAANEVNAKHKGSARTSKQAQTRWKTLKSTFGPFRRVVRRSGFSWDSENNMIDASDDLWETLAEEDAAAAELRDKVFEFYEEVDAIVEGGIANGEFALDPGAKASKNEKEEDSGTDEDSSDSPASDGEEVEGTHEDSDGQTGGEGKNKKQGKRRADDEEWLGKPKRVRKTQAGELTKLNGVMQDLADNFKQSEGASAEDNELQNAIKFFNLNDKAHFTTMEQLDIIDYFNDNKRGPFTYMAMSKADNADLRVDWLRKKIFST
ncbi:unnamed protein product [Tilletia laevis]|uniref:Myb/SANT-like domain-containing protein n=4 Tax=Tilletia TaxID=13289 RepID=A0A8X7SSK7_9BASI|nr:hypothetical protein CF328_g8075 [Tilletia controversa]KAE8184628.1 hypothetical protein CF335_g7962 [Tilletia laevis]KAE8242472.1 hypothetical protein A4X03_0g8023 [Tilletia caries]KAE8185579.1 hypothetical protein CF336_g7347 [Tilletia laevis]KAE8238119.1 hypothetical protein A4X06_0g8989 [Tilletia controversa]